MSVVEREVVAPVVTERERRASILEAAALEIEVRGWAREFACDEAGRLCAVGALKATLGADPDCNISDDLAAAIDILYGSTSWVALPEFNDDFGRTASDVTFLLRWRAAEIRDGL